jgi:hypothetical protein
MEQMLASNVEIAIRIQVKYWKGMMLRSLEHRWVLLRRKSSKSSERFRYSVSTSATGSSTFVGNFQTTLEQKVMMTEIYCKMCKQLRHYTFTAHDPAHFGGFLSSSAAPAGTKM